MASSERLDSLTGLRGLAAIVVVTHHALLLHPVFANAENGTDGRLHGAAEWFTYSPLHLIWSGSEAVDIFFVLSGLVLYLAAARPGFSWSTYYPQRLLRLYLPVWGAMVLGAVWVHLVHWRPVAGGSWWLNDHATHYSPLEYAFQVVTLNGADWWMSALWSLRWEIAFSVLLPLYLALAALVLRRTHWLIAITEWLVLAGVGDWIRAGQVRYLLIFDAGKYLPLFMIGCILGAKLSDLRERRMPMHQGVGLLIVGCALLESRWYFFGQRTLTPIREALSYPLICAGAALLVVLFATWRPLVDFGGRSAVKFVGERSFSLYLVHEPVVVSVGFLLGARHTWLASVVGILGSLVLAQVFYTYWERPSHRRSKLWGAAALRRVRPAT